MDPLSALFSSYLDMVTNITYTRVTDMMGTEVTALAVEHKGILIPYSYQIWRIKDDSVCASYADDMATYSKCTIAARNLFSDTCKYLQRAKPNHWKKKKLKNMYCNAAISYQPTIAALQWSHDVPALESARFECNMATAELMGSNDPKLKKKKQKVCSKYRKLQHKANQ